MMMNQRYRLRPRLRVFMGAGLLIGSGQIMAADDAATNTEAMRAIEVVGVTPTHGIGLPKDKIPTHIQSATNADLQRSQSLDLSDFMNQNLGSVNINAAQILVHEVAQIQALAALQIDIEIGRASCRERV